MTPEVKYERIGKFIYGAGRHGGEITDVYHWMADELGVARPENDDEAAQGAVQAGYLAKYVDEAEFNESHQRFRFPASGQ